MQNSGSKSIVLNENGASLSTYIWLTVIILAGAFLRFYNLEGTSLSNDELSALSRLRFSSFSDLLNRGVKIDGHPAGIQVFLYYYSQLFGSEAFTLRLPFAIFGILTIPVCFFWSRKWFGNFTGLFTATSVAFLQFPVYYSQLARPYAPGLFFSMFLLLCFTHLFFGKSHKKLWAILYILNLVACAYTHYFSLLFAVILWSIGFFFISKSGKKLNAIVALPALLFFIPHIKISIAQLQIGGLQWLGKPGMDFLPKFILYAFNDDWFVLGFAILTFSFTAIYAYQKKCFAFTKFHVLAVILFLMPWLIGFLKSIYGKPVLQPSVLLFSFPLLPAFLFSYTDVIKRTSIKYIPLFAWSVLCVLSLIVHKNYYKTEQYGQFKPLAEKVIEWNKKYADVNYIFNVNNAFYINYYLPEVSDTKQIKLYKCNQYYLLDSVFNVILNSNSAYFVYGWSNINNLYETMQIIHMKYTDTVENNGHFNSGILLLKKSSNPIQLKLQIADSQNNNNLKFPYIHASKNALLRVEGDLKNRNENAELIVEIVNKNETRFKRSVNINELRNPETDKIVWFCKLLPNSLQNDSVKIYISKSPNSRLLIHNFAAQLY